MNIRFDNFNTSEIQGLSTNLLTHPIPNKNEDRVEILGKHGTTLIGEKYNDRKVEIECFFIGGKNIKDNIRNFLTSIKPEDMVLISASNRPELFLVGSFNGISEYSFNSPTNIYFKLDYTARPEVYKIEDSSVNIENLKKLDDILALDISKYSITFIY